MVFGFSSTKKQDERGPKPSKLFAFRRKMHEAVAHIETHPTPADQAAQAGYQQASPYGHGYQGPVYPQVVWSDASSQHNTVPSLQGPASQEPVAEDETEGSSVWHPSLEGDHWTVANTTCSNAIEACRVELPASSSPSTIAAMLSNLTDQQKALGALEDYASDKQLLVLCQIYREVHPDAFDESNLLILLDVLRSGPDYLIDIATIECIIWQAEVIDPAFGIKLHKMLDGLVAEQLDLETFRRQVQAEGLLDTALNPPAGSVDDDLSQDALSSIRELVQQMRDRSSLVQAMPVTPTPEIPLAETPSSSTESNHSSVPAATSPALLPGYASYTAQQLSVPHVASSGLATGSPYYQSTPLPSPRPASPASTTTSQKSIFEYRGHQLTRSALDLVLRQEMLAAADSSGQYAGEVSFDDVRNAWIPKWAAKLRTQDLAEGEVPDTNPANYTIRAEDEWGNKIGWWNGRMYYEEEPKFG